VLARGESLVLVRNLESKKRADVSIAPHRHGPNGLDKLDR
jgi:hypothetical protein